MLPDSYLYVFCVSLCTGVPFVSSEDEEASLVTVMCPSGCPFCRILP